MKGKKNFRLAVSALALCYASCFGQSSQVGEWSTVQQWPLVAIHQMYLPDGRILVWGRGDLGDYAMIANPETWEFKHVGSLGTDIFCAGHSFLSDGTLFSAGGHIIDAWGTKDGLIFDPYEGEEGRWIRVPDMQYERWYPTCVTMPDGRVLTVSGSINKINSQITWADIPEVFDPETRSWTTTPRQADINMYYPFLFPMSNGHIFFAGPSHTVSRAYNPETNAWYNYLGPSQVYGTSAVSYEPGKILKSGGPLGQFDWTTSGRAAIIDLTSQNPSWINVPSMAEPRIQHDLTVLPDGTVLATGGSFLFDEPSTAKFSAELFDPVTRTWKTMSSMVTPRSYHSSAFLLKDGRVLVAGGGNGGGRRPGASQDYMSSETFSPPYLFKGPRPVITKSPSLAKYNETFRVSTDSPLTISSVCLIAPGAVTHGLDMNQRRVPLAFTSTAEGLTVTAPSSPNLAPPGPYMLFVLNQNGVPAVAKMITLASPVPDLVPQTVTTNGVLTGSVQDLLESDNSFLQLFMAKNGSKSGELSIEVTTESSHRHISSVELAVESRYLDDSPLKFDLWNYEKVQWDEVYSGVESSVKTIKSVTMTGYASKYVDRETSGVKARIRWKPDILSSRQGPAIDKISWKMTK